MRPSVKPHQCRHCDKVLSHRSGRDRHERALHMRCQTCYEVFSSAEDLQEHLGSLGKCPKELRCPTLKADSRVCGKRFHDREALDAHQLEVHPGNYEVCPTCERSCHSLRGHLKMGGCLTKKTREASTCGSCGNEFEKPSKMKQHQKRGCKGTMRVTNRHAHGTLLQCPLANEGCKSRHRKNAFHRISPRE